MAGLHFEEGQRQADEVVQIQGIFVHLKRAGQHLGDHLLGGGLAATAGDGHYGHFKSAAPGLGQIPQGGEGVVYGDDGNFGEYAWGMAG